MYCLIVINILSLYKFILFNVTIAILIAIEASARQQEVNEIVTSIFNNRTRENRDSTFLNVPWLCSSTIAINDFRSNKDIINFLRQIYKSNPTLSGHFYFEEKSKNTFVNKSDHDSSSQEYILKGGTYRGFHHLNSQVDQYSEIKILNDVLYIRTKRITKLKSLNYPPNIPFDSWQVCESKAQLKNFLRANGCTDHEIDNIFKNPKTALDFCHSEKTPTDPTSAPK